MTLEASAEQVLVEPVEALVLKQVLQEEEEEEVLQEVYFQPLPNGGQISPQTEKWQVG